MKNGVFLAGTGRRAREEGGGGGEIGDRGNYWYGKYDSS